MSSYYRPESKSSSSSYTSYVYIGSMNCNLKDGPLGGQECPNQTVDFNRKVGAALPSQQEVMTGPGYSMLGSAYPNVKTYNSQIYSNTSY